MIPLAHLWLPVVVAAVLVFLCSSAIHMALKWHNVDYRPLPNEEEVLEALRKGLPGPGQYVFPHCADHRDLRKEEVRKRFEKGPMGLLYLSAPGLPNMGRSLGSWFLYLLVVSCFVAYVASRTVPWGAPYLQAFRVAGTVAFLAYGMGQVPASIWMGKPWKVTFKDLLDSLVFGLVTAGAFGWLWPRP